MSLSPERRALLKRLHKCLNSEAGRELMKQCRAAWAYPGEDAVADFVAGVMNDREIGVNIGLSRALEQLEIWAKGEALREGSDNE